MQVEENAYQIFWLPRRIKLKLIPNKRITIRLRNREGGGGDKLNAGESDASVGGFAWRFWRWILMVG